MMIVSGWKTKKKTKYVIHLVETVQMRRPIIYFESDDVTP